LTKSPYELTGLLKLLEVGLARALPGNCGSSRLLAPRQQVLEYNGENSFSPSAINRITDSLFAMMSTNTKEEELRGKPNDGVPQLPLNLMKSLQRRKANSECGSSSGGNNSEDSALVSLGNTSFGFNFDSEEGITNETAPNSEQNSEDDGNGPLNPKLEDGLSPSPERTRTTAAPQPAPVLKPLPSLITSSSSSNLENSHSAAAANAVASLQSIAEHSYHDGQAMQLLAEGCNTSRKRKSTARSDNDSGGYNTDDDDDENCCQSSQDNEHQSSDVMSSTGSTTKSKKKRATDRKREERNAREKERSFRIAKKINELRDLLSCGGVIVPKGTKSSVLTEAANYIRMLQQHQYRSEM